MIPKLIRQIEEHWDPLTDRIIRKIRSDARLPHIGALPEGDLRAKARDILHHLGDWLTPGHDADAAERFRRIGRERESDRIPLQEVVLSYILVKDSAIDYLHDQGFANTLELWAEEEVEHKLGRFFDSLIYYLVDGYMGAFEASHPRPEAAGGRSAHVRQAPGTTQ